MLEYEWGNPSTIMLSGNEGGATTEPDQTHRQMFDHNHTFLPEPNQIHSPTLTSTTDFSHYHHFNFNPQQNDSFFFPRAFPSASSTSFSTLPPSMISLDPFPPFNSTNCGPRLMPVPNPEHVGRPMDFAGSSGLGLNLGGRTYFPFSSSSGNDFASRLYWRPNLVEPGSTASSLMSNSPRCQAQFCNADLSDAKHYHRRHKVCEFHSKASTVVAAGLTQRFCQQCSRFHLLSEFDNGKRSCRKRLADHNRRRRKTQQLSQENQPTLDDVARSPPESEAEPSSSVKVAASPPDYFQQRPDQSSGTSISRSLFFSSG